MPAPLTPDQLLEIGYELFLEQAADHLPPEDIVDITLEFEERGAVESDVPAQDWISTLGPFNPAEWIEILVGLLDHQDEFSVVFARILLPLSGDKSRGHIRWKPC